VRPEFSLERLRDQVGVWLFLVAILAVVGVTVRTFLDYRTAAIELLISRDQRLTYLSAARLSDELSKFADALTAVARANAIYGADPASQRQALRQAQPVQEGLFDGGIVLMNNFGQVIAAEPGLDQIVGEDWSDREYFRRMLSSRSAYFSDAADDPYNQSAMVVVSVPVLGEGGQFVGVLAGLLHLGEPTISPLYATIVRLRVGQESGSSYLLDSKGTILFDSASNKVGQRYVNPALSDIVLARQPGALRTHNSDNEQIIASFAPIPGTAWTLVVEDDWNTLTAETQQYLRVLIFLLALGLLLLAIGAVLFVRQRPYEALGGEQGEDAVEQIKRLLLPDAAPLVPGWKLSVHYQSPPDAEVDFYDLMLLHDGHLVIVMGDINHSGIAAAVLLTMARTTLRGAARSSLTPAAALERSNDFLCPELPAKLHIACVFGLLDPSTGIVKLANAGHLLPSYHNGQATEPLDGTGIPLGLQLGATYTEREISVAPGGWLLFYNRRLIDIRNAQGEAFGPARLREVIDQEHEGGEGLIAAILAAIRDFAGSAAEVDSPAELVVVERLADKR
jgi:serine phosphatase RsbU (regulator of sigma subunit)